MLNRLRNSLVFPKMVFIEGMNEGGGQERICKYKLDWGFFDQKMQQQYTYWRNKWQSDSGMPDDIAPSLPEKYNKEVKEYKYTVSDSMYHEIQNSAMKAAEEWSRYTNFDSDIRDVLHGPAIEYVRCAFTLLACSIEGLPNFSNDKELVIPITAMLYKFWVHQTGRGMALRNSGFYEIYNKAKNISQKINDDEILNRVQEFKEAIKLLEDDFYKNYASKKKKN